MTAYNMVAQGDGSTVVSEYTPMPQGSGYQSEADLENAMIDLLKEQGYEHAPIHDEKALIGNLRQQLEKLNHFSFSDKEWDTFFRQSIAPENEGVVDRTRRIQRDHVQALKLDNGTTKNIKLIDKENIHNNTLQVVNQYVQPGGKHDSRYDVTILVNGLPLVHAELKRRGINIKEAFNQIKRYNRDSFWVSSGLFEYVQIFIISNGTRTKYYSNSTREIRLKNKTKKVSDSFEFTSFWADAKNRPIPDLMDFTKTFLARRTILNILTRYCVFTEEEKLLVMRPYQIVATERILDRVRMSTELKKTGTLDAGGYIWHTTGSGKTLTSFKTAQLATKLSGVDKVIFVVDRKDLDMQTVREYDRFQKGAANSNTSTKVLQKQLEDPQARIIVTTIQKLDRFIAANKGHRLFREHVVLIFDECHRSQFGDMHKAISKAFSNYHMFGFTGTPIFAANAGGGHKTTEQVFGKQLHSYTVVDAINDHNVLPWHIDYVRTMRSVEGPDEQVEAIDTREALENPVRISEIVTYTLDNFRRKTRARSSGHQKGFNSLFAAQSIPMAMKYYDEFSRQISEREDDLKNLRVATIFSFNPNAGESDDGILPDEDFATDGLDETTRDFLDRAVADYNRTFGTNFDTGAGYERYYRDVSMRMKKREIDLLIVVNMFLTGFDAPTLNTLWADKNLKQHGLIQAFSRTNRILNSIKTYGTIVCFRNLERATEDALGLFGNKNAAGIVLLKDFRSYFDGYDENGVHHAGYAEIVGELKSRYQPGEIIVGEENKKEFVRLYGALLRLRNILVTFDEFEEAEAAILDRMELDNYQSMYLELHDEMRPEKAEKTEISDDLVFEMELVRHLEVTIDYILELVQKYCQKLCQDKEILVDIHRAIDSSIELRSKKELIDRFLSRVNPGSDVTKDWQAFVTEQKESDLKTLVEQEGLKEEESRSLLENAIQTGSLVLAGTWLDQLLLKPMSRFGGARATKKRNVEDKLRRYFETYLDV